jgi:hypothetical protein
MESQGIISRETRFVLHNDDLQNAYLFHQFESIVIGEYVDISLLNGQIGPSNPIKILDIRVNQLLNSWEIEKMKHGSVSELRVHGNCFIPQIMRKYGALKLVVGGIEINPGGTWISATDQ